MKTFISSLVLVLSASTSFADGMVNVDPASNCTTERSNLTDTVNSLTPTSAAGTTCKTNYATAANCCNGSGDGCAIVSVSAVNSNGVSGATQSVGSAYTAGANGLASNASLCEKKFNAAACTPTTQDEYTYKKNVNTRYNALQQCFNTKQVALNAQAASMSAQTAATSADGVTSDGIKSALYQGADQADATPTPTDANSQQSMNTLQKAVTTTMVCVGFCVGNPQGVTTISQPTTNISGSSTAVSGSSGNGNNP